MTAEASECNGRCEVSKIEFEGKGGDLKEIGGCDGIACRDGEEISGSFVIVNGDSDDQSDRDLDLDRKIDPLLSAGSSMGKEVVGDRGVTNEKRENGELTLENGHEIQKDDVVSVIGVEENGGERELCEKEENARLCATNGDGDNEKCCEENGENVELCSGIDAEGTTAVEGTANGREETKTAVEVEGKQEPEALVTETSAAEIGQEKEAEVVVTDTDQPEELGSAVEVEAEQNAETLIGEAEEKDSQTESGSAVKVEGVEPEVVVTETEHREELGSAAEVEQEKEAEAEVDKELGSSVEVEEKQAAETLIVGAEEKQEGDNQTESESDVKVEEGREPEDAVAETDHQVEFGSAVEVEDMNPQTSVTETDCSEELDSGARVEEKQEPEFVGTETDDNGVAESVEVEERRKPEAVVEETDRLVELETAVEVELKKEPEAVVEETDKLAELESAVEVELKQEPEAVVEETDKLEELESVVELELKLEPETVVEETNKLAELESAVEEELKQEPETVVEESDKVEAEEKQEPEAVVEETDSLVKLESAVEVESKQEPETVVAEAEKVEAEENQEPEVVVEETDKLAELKSAIEELKQEPETVVEESDKVEAEEKQEPEAVVEETDSLVELESAVEVKSKQEPETLVAEAEKVEAEENQEPEVVVTETTASECLPVENEEAVTPNAAAHAPIDETSAQNENGTIENDEANVVCDVNGGMDSTAEISGDSLEDESKGEARFIPLESSKSPIVCHVAEIEMVNEVACSIDDKKVELEVSNGSASNGETVTSEPKADNSIEDDEPRTSDPVSAMNLEPQTAELCPNNDTELETKPCIEVNETDKNVTSHHTGGTKLESESGNESAEGGECMASSIEEDQSTNKDDDEEPAHEQAEAAEAIQAPPEPHVVKRQQVFIVKVPRLTDDELQKKIQLAQSLVDEKTQSRDSIKDAIQKKKVVCNQYEKDLEAAKAEERAARAAVSAKRQEIDTVQAMINKMKNATTIADIDDKIRNMVHRQQHETISLKQEKQYIHEINQLKHLREQLSAKRAPQEQIDEALGQRDEIESRFKTFKKELDSLRATVSQAESRTKIAWKRYDDEHQLLQNLQEQYKVAADIRQEAYGHFLKLRKQSNEKIKHFKMYKADQQAAMNYIFSGDNEGLRSYCSRQIERIMELWNNNQEFREQYIKSNYNSTLRRLGTLDGRSLGPGEEAPILRSYVDKRSNIVSLPSSNIETPAPTLALEVKESSGEPLATEQVARTNQSSKLKSSTKPTSKEGIMATISTSEELKEEEKENKLTKEEEELARKAEELARKEEEFRKEKAAAELKERLRLEQRAKAREAEERKKRRVEKAQAKAEYRAQKEAELKEKKKAKKENKKAGTVDTPNGGVEGESAPVTDSVPPETSQESETKVTTASMKRSARTAAAVKQYNRVQPLPLPLRNKGKRKMATWMWVLLTTLLVLILFFAGNYVTFSKFSLSDFGF